MRKVRRILTRLFIIFLIAATLFTVAGIIISRQYGDDIKNYTINQVNRQLETKLTVDHVNFSFFSKFPYVSVVFSNVTAMSGHDFQREEFGAMNTDTLFNAKKIYLQFNIIDVLFGNYHIRRIQAARGRLNMLVDQEGMTNFRLFKNRKEVDGKSKAFELEAVKISDFDVCFINLAKNITSRAYMNDVLFKGRFSARNYSVGTVTSFELIEFSRANVKYADHFKVSTRIVLSMKDSLAEIEKGEVSINNLRMNIDGRFSRGEVSVLDLELQGRDFDLHALQSALPEPQRNAIPVDIYGRGDVAIRVNGNFSRVEMPAIRAVYLLNIAKARYRNRSFQNIRVKGKFSNGSLNNPVSTSISVDQFKIEDYKTSLEGSFAVENLTSPSIRLTLKGNVSADAVNEFFSSGKAHDFNGILHPDFSLQTHLTSWKFEDAERILSSGLDGKLSFEDFGFTLDDKYIFSGIDGNIQFAGDTWYPELNLTTGLTHLDAKLQMEHVFNYLLDKDGTMWISGNVNASRLDLSPFIKNDGDDQGIFAFPKRIHARLQVAVDTISAGKFFAGKSNAFLQYKPGMLSLSSIEMASMDGSISGEAAVVQDHDKNLYLSTRSKVKHMNINTMFYSLNNFNQDFIVSRNLKGYLSGEIEFATSFDSLLSMSSKNTVADARITINSGELIDFEPIKKLSKFIELDELEDINFSKLENHIIIKDQQVFIPQMEINSSAFNINISGVHRFDNHFDYKLKINLSEFLAGKARNAKKENDEFEVVEADGRRTNLYLTLIGTPDDFKIKYDKKEAIVNIKQDIKEEKGILKNILNDEFGWFRKDSSDTVGKKKDNTDNKFIIDWDLDSKADSVAVKTGKEKQTEKKKFRIEWDDDDK